MNILFTRSLHILRKNITNHKRSHLTCIIWSCYVKPCKIFRIMFIFKFRIWNENVATFEKRCQKTKQNKTKNERGKIFILPENWKNNLVHICYFATFFLLLRVHSFLLTYSPERKPSHYFNINLWIYSGRFVWHLM